MKFILNSFVYGLAIGAILGIAWCFGDAHGKKYWGKRYEWINDELRTDIINCRTTLNQCKKDLEDPHRCITVCMDEFQKYGC